MEGAGARVGLGRAVPLLAMSAQREFDVVIVAEVEGGYIVFVPELPSVATQGETIEEARANAQEAIEGYLKVMHEDGLLIPTVQPPGGSQKRTSMGDRHADHRRTGRVAAVAGAGRREGPAKPMRGLMLERDRGVAMRRSPGRWLVLQRRSRRCGARALLLRPAEAALW
jgi:predicted RNase H-like HicB family nuclease